jgi:Outer membrane protein beta-barrel domain
MSRLSITGAALALAGLMSVEVATAQGADEATKGFYIGAAAGQARFDDSFSIDDLDREDTSWKALAGWRFADQFSIEGSYVDFGESTAPGALGINPFAQEAKAWMLQAVGYIAIPYVDLFAKLGAARVEAEGRGANVAGINDRTTEFAYGWGAQWRWRSLAIRGEYERFDADVIGDLNMVSLGVTYTLPLQR